MAKPPKSPARRSSFRGRLCRCGVKLTVATRAATKAAECYVCEEDALRADDHETTIEELIERAA